MHERIMVHCKELKSKVDWKQEVSNQNVNEAFSLLVKETEQMIKVLSQLLEDEHLKKIVIEFKNSYNDKIFENLSGIKLPSTKAKEKILKDTYSLIAQLKNIKYMQELDFSLVKRLEEDLSNKG